MKIKRTIISKIDMDKFKEIVSLEESGHISHDEATELFIESKKYECRIDIIGTIKENVKYISDVIKSYAIYYIILYLILIIVYNMCIITNK